MFQGQFREDLSGRFLIQAFKPKLLHFEFLGAPKFDTRGGYLAKINQHRLLCAHLDRPQIRGPTVHSKIDDRRLYCLIKFQGSYHVTFSQPITTNHKILTIISLCTVQIQEHQLVSSRFQLFVNNTTVIQLFQLCLKELPLLLDL